MTNRLRTFLLLLALTDGDALGGPTLDTVKARGKLACAANGNRAGFSALDSRGQWKGMDVDTCRAVAAAVLGDANKVELLQSTTQTRLTVLQTGEVDVTTANVTWTLTRDAKLGIDFVTHFVHGRARRAMRSVTLLFAAGISALMAWHGYGLVQLDYGSGVEVGGIPGWIVEAVIPVGFGLLALRLALRAFATPREDALPVLAPELP